MKKIEVSIIKFWKWVFIIASAVAAIAISFRIYNAIDFRNNCSVHIFRANNAPTAEVAAEELSIAIKAMEEYGLTEGKVTGIIEEENSLGYYYQTLIDFRNELRAFNLDIESEVYNVELNALQSRLKENSLPYFISLGSMFLVWVYLLSWAEWFVIMFIFLYVYNAYRYSDTIILRIPTLNFGRTL